MFVSFVADFCADRRYHQPSSHGSYESPSILGQSSCDFVLVFLVIGVGQAVKAREPERMLYLLERESRFLENLLLCRDGKMIIVVVFTLFFAFSPDR